MRVHYTGPPIVPARNKNNSKKQGLAPLLAVQDVAVAAPPPPTGLSLALSIKTEEAPSAAPAGAGRVVVRLFGIDISPKAQAPLLEQQCSGTTGFLGRRCSTVGCPLCKDFVWVGSLGPFV